MSVVSAAEDSASADSSLDSASVDSSAAEDSVDSVEASDEASEEEPPLEPQATIETAIASVKTTAKTLRQFFIEKSSC